MGDIENIFKSSKKAELLEIMEKELITADKAIVILIEDKDESKYTSRVMTLGLDYSYEAYGILDVAKQDLQNEDC